MAGDRPTLMTQPLDAEALYRTHVRPLYTFIYSKVGNRETAEDLTSDVFMKALMRLDPTREEHSIVAWLYRVAHNAVADYWRAGRGARVIAFEETRSARQSPPAADVGHEEQGAARARALLAQNPGNGGALYALSAACTHMGCLLSWLPSASSFLCPCHGAQYNADGTVLSGVARHPLPRVQVRVGKDGHLYVWAVTAHPTVTTVAPYTDS